MDLIITDTKRTERPDVRCGKCGLKAHEHDKERVYTTEDERAPPGSYYYEYNCPEE